jgi:NADH:ubiquinone oxidoreductase subunit 6 (subunit J)
MYDMLNAHFLSVVIVVGSIMVTPIYVMATYVFSGASASKGWQIGCVFLLWGAFMSFPGLIISNFKDPRVSRKRSIGDK